MRQGDFKKIGTLELPGQWYITVEARYDGEEWIPQMTLDNNAGMTIPIPATMSTPHDFGAFMTSCAKRIDKLAGADDEAIEKWMQSGMIKPNATYWYPEENGN